MRAVVLSKYGGPEVLEVRDVPRPEPGPGELLVRVMASSANPVEAKIRAAGSWSGIPLPAVLGYDAAGIVESKGAGVTEFSPGDPVYFTPEIFGNAHGTHAEFTVVPAAIVAPHPATTGYIEAAAIPLAGGSAYEAIVRRLAVTAGESVLIHGGAGGVGSYAVQIARAIGARVFATAGPDNQGLLRELGADVAIDYRKDDFAEIIKQQTGGKGVDAAFDTVGGDLISKSVPAVRPFGRLATILGSKLDLSGLYVRNQTLHGIFLTRERARLVALSALVEQGKLRSVIDRVLPLEEVVEAHRRLDGGHGRGKIVFQISSPG